VPRVSGAWARAFMYIMRCIHSPWFAGENHNGAARSAVAQASPGVVLHAAQTARSLWWTMFGVGVRFWRDCLGRERLNGRVYDMRARFPASGRIFVVSGAYFNHQHEAYISPPLRMLSRQLAYIACTALKHLASLHRYQALISFCAVPAMWRYPASDRHFCWRATARHSARHQTSVHLSART